MSPLDCVGYGDFSSDDVALRFCNNSEIVHSCMSVCQALTCKELGKEPSPVDRAIDVVVKVLTYFLVAGFAATVEYKHFWKHFRCRGVYIGLFCQFIILPALGFFSVAMFKESLPPLYAVILLVVTACPGGAYSNWFCSVFNADLGLSVAMTSASSLLAVVFLPANVFLYVSFAYARINQDAPENIERLLPYDTLIITLVIVLAGVVSGLVFSSRYPRYMRRANLVGNVAGVLLQICGYIASGTSCAPPWEQPSYVFALVAAPLLGGVCLAILASSLARMPRPQQLAVAIETAYQNIGIALSISLSLGSAGREAAAIPVLYGIFEAIIFFALCFSALFLGWTLSPKDEKLWKVLINDYQGEIATHPHYRKRKRVLYKTDVLPHDEPEKKTNETQKHTVEVAWPEVQPRP